MLDQVRHADSRLATPPPAPRIALPTASLLPCLQPRRGRRPRAPLLAGHALLVIVLLLVGAVFVLAVGLVMPALFPPLHLISLHGPMAALLAFNILL